MKFLLINLGEGAVPHGSGGTERVSNIAHEFQLQNHECEFLGTIGLVNFLKSKSVAVPVRMIPIPRLLSKEKSKLDRFLVYLWTTFKLSKYLNSRDFNFVYSASDFFPDVIASYIVKKQNPNIQWIAIIHHQAKLNFKNLLTFVTSLGSFLAQQATWTIISKHGSLVLLYDSNEGRMISKLSKFKNRKLGFIQNGINFELIENSKPAANSLDLLLCGGPRQSKGVLDLPSILELVKIQYPNVRVGLAGHGTPNIIRILNAQLEGVGMASNVKFFGNLPKSELYSLMKSSRIVISLSYEEGWGIAVREALACGRPCVAYRIPAFQDLEEYLNFVDLGDTEAMSREIIALLDSFNQQKPLSYQPVGASWREVAQKELAFILGKIG